jgi:hypothetical protein
MKTVKTLKLITSCLLLSASMCFVAPLHAAPKPRPTPTAQEKLPVAVPVPGKTGLVYSPYAKGKIIAVAGSVMGHPDMHIEYKHGEIVRWPYNGRMFRVP